MGNVVQFNGKRRRVTNSSKQSNNHTIQGSDSFQQQVDLDTLNLSKATGKTLEEAVQIAGDFYRRYPMLMEFVRSPEYMLRGK